MGGDSEDEGAAGADSRVGSRIELLDCEDWQRADPREREDTIEAIRQVVTRPVGPGGGRGAALDDDRAYEVFERQCRQDFAASFRLYKLYTRAAAFQHRRPPESR